EDLSVAELEALLKGKPEAEPEPATALDYISRLLGASPRAAAPTPMVARLATPTAAEAWSPAGAPPAGPASSPAPADPAAGAPAPRPVPPAAPAPKAASPAASPWQAAPPPPAAGGAAPADETSAVGRLSGFWRRVMLAPGVELHYQPSADPGRESGIARLIREAARLLAERDEGRRTKNEGGG